ALTFLVILACLKAMRLPPRPRPRGGRGPARWARFSAGVRYVRAHAPIRDLLLVLGFTGLVGLAFSTLLPVVARYCLAGGPHTLVDDDKRGRVMSLYALAFLGIAPFGSLWLGALAHRLGAPEALGISGAVLVLTGGVFGARLRALAAAAVPHYRRLRLIPRTG